MSAQVTCSSCSREVPRQSTELLASGDGFICQDCATSAQIQQHEQHHRKRRGLLVPALLGAMAGVLLGLFHGGTLTLLMVHVLGIVGAALGIGARLAQRALAERIAGGVRHWLAGAIYGVPIAAVGIAIGYPNWGLSLGALMLLAFGVQSRIDFRETKFQMRSMRHADTQLAVFSVAAMIKHWREMILMAAGAGLFVAMVFALLIGVENAERRDRRQAQAEAQAEIEAARALAREAAAREAAALAEAMAKVEPCPEQAPEVLPDTCPAGTTPHREEHDEVLTVDELCMAPDDLAHGRFLRRYPTGEPRQEGYFCHGDKSLVWTARHRDGAIKSQGRYSDGVRVGRWRFVKRELGLETYQTYDDAGDLIDEGFAADPVEVTAAHEQACQGGDAAACAMAGRMYDDKFRIAEVPEADLERATRLYRRACDGGQADTCTRLGEIGFEDASGERERRRARAWFERGCSGGHGDACLYLGQLSEDEGEGESAGALAAAADFYRRACDADNGVGCAELLALAEADPALASTLPATVEALRERACRLDHDPSCAARSRAASGR
ncbi:hypothetical protein [Haliangium sp.]|uniref:hypothetical protein n=1 Tax=Haliangium sp. TaxID=2663208 RepID=UPI003D09743A